MQRAIAEILLIALIALGTSGPAFAQDRVTQGPLELRDQHPLSLLHSTFRPQDASIPTPGTTRLGINFSWSNTFNFDEKGFRVDTETRVGDLFVRYGLTPGLEVQFSQNIIWRGSGETDNLINEFHKAFNIPNAKSELVPSEEYAIQGVNKDGTTFQFNRDGTGLGGLEAALKYSPSNQSDQERWAVLFGLGLPTATSDFGQRGLDFQLALYGQAGVQNLMFYAGAAIFYYTDTEINNLEFPSPQYAGFLGAQYPVDSAVSFYLGSHLASILLEEVEGYPDYQTYLDFGFRSAVTETLSTLR